MENNPLVLSLLPRGVRNTGVSAASQFMYNYIWSFLR